MAPRRLLTLALLVPWAIWALVRVLGVERGYPLVAIIAFTPYAALTSPLPVLVALALKERRVAVLGLVPLVCLVVVVAPRAFGGTQTGPGRPLVVMTANLRFGLADPEAVVRLVRTEHVDVLALEELTDAAVHRLDAAGLRQLLPGRVLAPRSRAAGAGLYARERLHDEAGLFEARPAATTESGIRIQVVHPPPPITRPDTRKWRSDLRAIPGGRRIVLGDFNATLDHHELRAVLGRGYVDAAATSGDGLAWTYGRRFKLTIDHVLVPPTWAIRAVRVRTLAGSDHRAVIAELRVPVGR